MEHTVQDVAAILKKLHLPAEAADVIKNCRSVTIPKSREEYVKLTLGNKNKIEVAYEIDGKCVVEAEVVRCKNGVSVNFVEDYMRKRVPDALIVADNQPTDKPKFKDVYGEKFDNLREETFEWLKAQDLIITPIMAGGTEYGYEALLIAPANAAFFALALVDLQFFVNIDEHKGKFTPRAVLYLAPPFRHTYFQGKQIVVHNRLNDVYEMFSYNFYPGPSAKKGIFGFLLEQAEHEGWTVAHASAVKIITPYDNEIVIMHEGASGCGKSEISDPIHREPNGKILMATNSVTDEKRYLSLGETCELQPIADDMVLCLPEKAVKQLKAPSSGKKLVIQDGEPGWFLRVDHIKKYGTDPGLERACVHPTQPLVFLNMQGTEGSTCLLWEHAINSNGKPCSNPRVILPKKMAADTVIDVPTEVDIRSFGVRTPPCTNANPSYGIIGMLHILPPALAWLWRLVAPRGFNNPSIDSTKGETKLIESEGVGSYEPFLTGTIVTQANLLLEQVLTTTYTRYVLIPNQHIGCNRVGFMPEWISREYIARRGGAKFKQEHLIPSRCALLGFCLETLKIDGQLISRSLLRTEMQPEVGIEGYDKGAAMLTEFFKNELGRYLTPKLNPVGKQIIECCLNDATLEEYMNIIPMRY